MKARPTYNLIRHIHLAVFIPMILLAVFTFLFYILIGLKLTYQSKIDEAHRISKLLAISSATVSSSVVAGEQIVRASSQDTLIDTIKFYSIGHVLEGEDAKPLSLIDILTLNSVSVHEPVILESPVQPTLNDSHSPSLLGYINTTIDLNRLRKHWFSTRKYFLLGAAFSYIALAWMIYSRMRSPLKELEDFSILAGSLSVNPEKPINTLLSKEMQFVELDNIQALILTLDNRLSQLDTENKLCKKYLDANDYRQVMSVEHSSFQSMMTHELKTSLNTIFGGLKLLDNYYLSHEQQDAVSVIQKGSTQLESILNQIIQLNRIEKGLISIAINDFQPTQLISELVHKYLQDAETKNLTINSRINHVECILQGDEQKISSILDVLIGNAVKFTQQGEIIIESNLLYFEHTIRWTINVIDTGIGIESKYLNDIFSPFFQINPTIEDNEVSGVGVGLGLAKKLAHLLNGQLIVQSTEGQGSQFTLILQLQNTQQRQQNEMLNGTRIVYLGASDQYHDFDEALRGYGAEVVQFNNSDEMLNYIEHNLTNILLIGKEVPESEVIKLAALIRDEEVSSRLLIVYYNDSLPMSIINRLHAAGVDYCESFDKSYAEQASLISCWLSL